MFDVVYWLVVLSTIVTLGFAWGIFLSQTLRRKTQLDEEYEKFEERILELMGQFRHMSAVRLQMLDRKMEEMRKLIKQANSLYSRLCVRETEVMSSFSKTEEGEIQGTQQALQGQTMREPQKTEYTGTNQEETETPIERKILLMFQEGKSEQQIAKELNIGVGEVNLVLSLFRFRNDLHQ